MIGPEASKSDRQSVCAGRARSWPATRHPRPGRAHPIRNVDRLAGRSARTADLAPRAPRPRRGQSRRKLADGRRVSIASSSPGRSGPAQARQAFDSWAPDLYSPEACCYEQQRCSRCLPGGIGGAWSSRYDRAGARPKSIRGPCSALGLQCTDGKGRQGSSACVHPQAPIFCCAPVLATPSLGSFRNGARRGPADTWRMGTSCPLPDDASAQLHLPRPTS